MAARKRVYTELSLQKVDSEEQYLTLLSDLKDQNREAIVAPFFTDKEGKEIGYGVVNAYGAYRNAGVENFRRTPGIDFIIVNNAGFSLDIIHIKLTGKIGGQTVTLISQDVSYLQYSGDMV